MKEREQELARERSRRRAALMARTQQGDREACRELLDDIGPPIMNFLRRRIADRGELEDTYQETLLAMYQARHTYDPARPLEPWLFAIARNIASDYARKRWSRASWEELVETLPDRPAEATISPARNLEQALEQLPESQREAFAMLKLEGLSIEEAALRAGTSQGALKVRAHRAYKALKKIFGGSE